MRMPSAGCAFVVTSLYVLTGLPDEERESISGTEWTDLRSFYGNGVCIDAIRLL